MGASRVVDVRTEQLAPVMAELGMTEGFDVGLEMSGAEAAFNQMLDAMNHGGRIAVLGHPRRADDPRRQRRDLQGPGDPGIYGRRIFETWYKMAAMLQSGLDVSGIVTHELPADRFEEAFEIVERRRVRQGHPRLGLSPRPSVSRPSECLLSTRGVRKHSVCYEATIALVASPLMRARWPKMSSTSKYTSCRWRGPSGWYAVRACNTR